MPTSGSNDGVSRARVRHQTGAAHGAPGRRARRELHAEVGLVALVMDAVADHVLGVVLATHLDRPTHPDLDEVAPGRLHRDVVAGHVVRTPAVTLPGELRHVDVR